MAAFSYIPSIHDKLAENKKIWALFWPRTKTAELSDQGSTTTL
ncbi:hypothetical protein FQN60_016184 [Etheostoma spectabile]|uniref:Uncharacterized protein n=1 Tax=Etheostoma spectabile TaxID=54343 RepID=A0A5J5CYB4_9PERO|nr:hypothetical protein FQN60_016184 [Etheostoma spectabile]